MMGDAWMQENGEWWNASTNPEDSKEGFVETDVGRYPALGGEYEDRTSLGIDRERIVGVSI